MFQALYSWTLVFLLSFSPLTEAQTITRTDSKISFERPAQVCENVGCAPLRLKSRGLYGFSFQVSFTCVELAPAEAKNGTDFISTSHTVTFDAVGTLESTSSQACINIVDDVIPEEKESFHCVILRPHGLARRGIVVEDPNTINYTICDDDTAVPPNKEYTDVEIYIDTTTYSAPEDNPVVPCPVRLSAPYPEPITVTIDLIPLDGVSPCKPATGGVDFVSDIFPIDVVFPANTTILEASFTLIDDNVIECDEAFGFALVYNGCQPGVSLRPGSSSGNLTIVDDDAVEISFERSAQTVKENVGCIPVQLKSRGLYAELFKISFTCAEVAPVEAENGTDFVSTLHQVEFYPFEESESTSSRACITVLDDEIAEAAESFSCEILIPRELDGIVVEDPNTIIFTICDDDNAVPPGSEHPEVEIYIDTTTYRAPEGNPVVSFPVRLSAPYPHPIPVTIDLVPLVGVHNCEKATGGVDFVSDIFPIDVVFPANTTILEANFTLIDDKVMEVDEQFKFALFHKICQPGVSLRPRSNSGSLTIVDDDAVEISFERPAQTVKENVGCIPVQLKSRGSYSCPFIMFVVCWGVGPVKAEAGADFIYDVPTVSFDAVGTLESTSSEDCITIVDDRIAEFNESLRCFILRKPEMRGIVVKDPNATTFTICDDDQVEIYIDTTTYLASEGNPVVPCPVRLSAPYPQPIPVTIELVPLDGVPLCKLATGGVDFVDIFPVNVVVPANTTILEASFTLIDDNVTECDEAFGFALVYNGSQPGVSLRPGSSSGNLTIVDDDVPPGSEYPKVEIYIDTTTYLAPESNPDVPCPVRLNAPYPHPIPVTIELVPLDGVLPCNLATGGVDFVDIFPVDVVVPANTTILEASFTLIDDNVTECDEAFGFALVYKGSQPGVSLRPDSSSGNLTIVDDDVIFLRFENTRYSVREDAGSVSIHLEAVQEDPDNPGSYVPANYSCEVSVKCKTIQKSAKAGKDFIKKSSPVLFSKGSQYSAPFTVSIISDSKPECPEKFRVKCTIRRQLRNRVKFLGSNVATVKITDNLSASGCARGG